MNGEITVTTNHHHSSFDPSIIRPSGTGRRVSGRSTADEKEEEEEEEEEEE